MEQEQTEYSLSPELNKYDNIIFLDCDGVLNSEIFFTKNYQLMTKYDGIPFYKTVKKYLRKLVKKKEISRMDYHKSQIDSDAVDMVSEICEKTNTAVVVSSTWRSGTSIKALQEMFDYCGGTFTVIGKTGHSESRIRGVEIYEWLKEYSNKWFGVEHYDFYRYAILDDDTDMMLWQQNHFFHTDRYCGLSPDITYRIIRYFTHKTF
jgi:hypothetical protein